MDDATRAFGSVTANGNGDGRISFNQSTGNNESLRAWQHFNLAGMVNVSYSGVNSSQTAIINVNIPASDIEESSAGYYFDYINWLGSDSFNALIIGREDGTLMNDASAFSVSSARSIDSKIDDENPATGDVLANRGSDNASSGCYVEDEGEYSYEATTSDNLVCIQAYAIIESN